MNALSHPEIEPVLIRQSLSVPALAHVRVAAPWHLLGSPLREETLVLCCKVFLHKFFSKYFPSHPTWGNCPSNYELEYDHYGCEGHISEEIQFFLVPEEH